MDVGNALQMIYPVEYELSIQVLTTTSSITEKRCGECIPRSSRNPA
jgi:hypothetical protein